MTTITSADREILDRLRSNPVIQDAEKAVESEKLASRKKLLDQYAEILKQSTNNELQRAEEAAKSQYETALASFKKVEKKYIEAHEARANDVFVFDRSLRNIERDLLENSDKRIEKAIKAWGVEMERIAGIESFGWSEPTGQFDKFTGDKICEDRSNLAALRSLVNQIQGAIVDLKKMRFKYFEDVEVEITKIVSDLPAIGSIDMNYGR